MRKKYLFTILILAIVVLAGCSGINTSDQEEQMEQSYIPTDSGLEDNSVKIDNVERTHQEESIIDLERMDHSIKNDDDKTIAVVYFDKPIVEGDNDAAVKINAYFEDEYERWLNGTASRLTFYDAGRMQWFEDCVDTMRTMLGDSQLATAPIKLEYTVNTKIIYEDQDILSILQIKYISAGGPNSITYFGSTFNLQTGELIPFTYFTDVNADDFRNSLSAFLLNNEYPDHYSETALKNYVKLSPNHDFDYAVGNHHWDFSYEYFYDGTSICLIENQIGSTSYIMPWNGKTGDQFSATLFRSLKDIELLLEGFMKRNN